MRQAKTEGDQVLAGNLFALKCLNQTVDQFVIARQSQLKQVVKSQRSLAQRWVDAAIRDVLLQKRLKETPGDIGGRCFITTEGEVKRKRIAAACEQMVVALPQQLRCAVVRGRGQNEHTPISQQRSLLHNLAQLGVAAEEFIAIDASENAQLGHYCSCESADAGRPVP